MGQWRKLWAMVVVGVLACLLAAFRPSRGQLWGVALDGNPLTEARLRQVTAETRLSPGLVVFFLQWPVDPGGDNFPGSSLAAIAGQQALPCITWEPMYYQNGHETMIPHQQITSGAYDRYLVAFARQARAWGRPVIIRFAHEMNTSRYHWGTSREEYGPSSPAAYVAMFRHVVDVFRQEGAGNVRWAFCPNAESIPNPLSAPEARWNRAAAYFPGREYVDVLGMDGYNWGTTQSKAKHGWSSRWQSFAEIFAPLHAELEGMAPGLPIMVFETASARQGGDKQAWIMEAWTTARQWELAAVSWFQVNKEIDWRLQQGVDFSYVPLVEGSAIGAGKWLGQPKPISQ